jgi:hypothetical protein
VNPIIDLPSILLYTLRRWMLHYDLRRCFRMLDRLLRWRRLRNDDLVDWPPYYLSSHDWCLGVEERRDRRFIDNRGRKDEWLRRVPRELWGLRGNC